MSWKRWTNCLASKKSRSTTFGFVHVGVSENIVYADEDDIKLKEFPHIFKKNTDALLYI